MSLFQLIKLNLISLKRRFKHTEYMILFLGDVILLSRVSYTTFLVLAFIFEYLEIYISHCNFSIHFHFPFYFCTIIKYIDNLSFVLRMRGKHSK